MNILKKFFKKLFSPRLPKRVIGSFDQLRLGYKFAKKGHALPMPGETYADMVKRCADEKSPLIIGEGDKMNELLKKCGVKVK